MQCIRLLLCSDCANTQHNRITYVNVIYNVHCTIYCECKAVLYFTHKRICISMRM